ncbi:retrovirus-related Pol polyprotein from transposon 17.6 [Trichonephila clavata]|uniref:Retrovirus-related Pol polyprotein from transposon 17.6 n=1 Tax=Trichonephila clavata TaxID=2740835 RepID=A0A8X6L369_TRICU|nr:retrovirus-related Pol polyprotein from transposon 17.6 [Trichonephila clavata]
MKPSQLLRKIKSLAGENITEKVLRTLWLDKLPDSIKNILVVSSENFENLSVMADKIFELNSSPEIYSDTADNSAMKNILDKRLINEVLFGLEFVFPYLDDILIASDSEEQHKTHLKLVFDRLQKYGLRMNIPKSTLGVTQLEFLGYLITPEGSKPLPEKVEVILSYKTPETVRELRTFLGLINSYRRYLKDAAKNQAIFHEYLKGSKKNDKTKILRTEEANENFENCKQDLALATLLSFPDPDLQLALFTDASNFAIGSVL